MGVTFHEFKFLEYFSNTYDFGDVLTLGKQEIILDEDDKKKLNLKIMIVPKMNILIIY